MNKQERYDKTYLSMAKEWAKLSHCTRKQVGALVVKNGMIISDGYNGTPTGFDNMCENGEGETNWYVIHGEANAILKCARHGHSCDGATLYQTHSPCKDCSKLILQSGIKRLVYGEDYKDTAGLDFLRDAGVEIIRYDEATASPTPSPRPPVSQPPADRLIKEGQQPGVSGSNPLGTTKYYK